MPADATVQRVRREFQEMPGLCVTVAQAARLFGIPHDESARILSQLAEQRVIQQSGGYFGALRTEFVGALFVHPTGRWHR